MPDIFLSYARADRDRAERLARAIEAHGWSVWWDQHIPAGHSFADVIQQQLDSARCVVVLWTRTSVASDWVQNEAEEGKLRTVLLPIRLDDVRLPLGFRRLQTLDLLGWNGEATPELEACLASIDARLGPRPAPAAASVTVPAEVKRTRVKPIALIAAAIAFVALLVILMKVPSSPEPQSTDTTATQTATNETTATATAPITTSSAAADAPAITQTTAPPPVEKASVRETPREAARITPAPGRKLVRLETSEGNIVIECFNDLAPKHAGEFTLKVRLRRYDGLHFHYVKPGVMIVGGHVGTFFGYPADVVDDFTFDLPPETTAPAYEPGMVALAHGTDGNPRKVSDIFIIRFAPNPPKGTFTYFGRVIEGMDLVKRISEQPANDKGQPVRMVKIQKAVLLQPPAS